MIKKLATGAAVLFLLGLGAAPATADPGNAGTLQDRIDSVLVDYPGGVQVSENEISWEEGAILLTFPSPSARAIGSCATGSYCAFSTTNYGGTKMSFTGCSATGTTNSVSALGGSVRSIANARTSGTVKASNGATAVRSIAANSGVAANAAAVTTLTCTT